MDKMLDIIITDEQYNCFVLCEHDNKLVLMPCDDAMSGYYPVYEKMTVVLESLNIFKVFNKFGCGFGCGEYSVDGILFVRNSIADIEIHYVEDSWDGFQVISELS